MRIKNNFFIILKTIWREKSRSLVTVALMSAVLIFIILAFELLNFLSVVGDDFTENNADCRCLLLNVTDYADANFEFPIEVHYIGVIPQVYPVKRKKVEFKKEQDQKIYDICVNTLQLCMMEHYVDCPWREQCLYVFDSRNQMLCGYYAFEDGNAEYARSNLKLMSEDRRKDGLLSICYPCGIDLTIPSFSLHYFLAVREYVEHSGDKSFAIEIYPKLRSVLQAFVSNIQEGLVCKFAGKEHWNFYDWSEYLDGRSRGSDGEDADVVINSLFILALKHMQKIDEMIGKEFEYLDLIESVSISAKKAFFNQVNGVFSMLEGGDEYTVLGNALAILAGLATKEEAQTICEKIISGELSECSLSVRAFKYDALLITDEPKYAKWVLDEIRRDYQVMLDFGSTTVWETLDGAKAFHDAGSLCHGWSSIPIYYFHKLLK